MPRAARAEIERNLDKPFARQKELDALAAKVRKLAEEIAQLAEKVNSEANGAVAAEMGDQGDQETEETPQRRNAEIEAEKDEEHLGGGGGAAPDFGKREESLLKPNMTPEQREWHRQNWHGNTPIFGMGAMGIGAPDPTGLRGAYVRGWDRVVDRMQRMKSEEGQRIAD